tara:strand:+ start:46 stop:510 length:465 start_codon:yes stop_codon:yes gene_type:complete
MLPETNNLLLKKRDIFNSPSKRLRNYGRKSWLISDDLIASFRYASQGLFYTFRTQRNFRIHTLIASFAFVLGIWLKLNAIQLSILILTIAAVLVLELINTAIEAAVDMAIGRRFHPLARIAKDCSAAAVLIASISSLLIGSFLLLPPFLLRLGF